MLPASVLNLNRTLKIRGAVRVYGKFLDLKVLSLEISERRRKCASKEISARLRNVKNLPSLAERSSDPAASICYVCTTTIFTSACDDIGIHCKSSIIRHHPFSKP